MNILYALTASILFGCAIYLILSRHLVRLLIGFSLLATATNLILFQVARYRTSAPPVLEDGATQLGESADPLPQALILTAIVIGFALTLVLSVLTLRAWRSERTLDTAEIESAEDLGDPTKPAKRLE